MIELRSNKSTLQISSTIWMMTIELAALCGWRPAGTHRGDAVDGMAEDDLKDVRHLIPWQMEYLAGDGQTVSRQDGAALADALVRAIDDGDKILADWIAGRTEPPAVLRTPSTGFPWFTTPEGKAHLKAVADFCRKDKFRIF